MVVINNDLSIGAIAIDVGHVLRDGEAEAVSIRTLQRHNLYHSSQS